MQQLSRDNGGGRVLRVELGLGVDAGFSRAHFEEHFHTASAATMAEGAVLAIRIREGDALTLEALEIEDT